MRNRMQNSSRRNRAAVAVVAAGGAVAALAGVGVKPVHADYVLDLRAVEIDGQPIGGVNTPKDVLIAPGAVVKLQLYAQVHGANAVRTDDGAGDQMGNIVSATGGLFGDLIASPYGGDLIDTDGDGVGDTRVRNFADLGSQTGKVQDLDGDGDLDVGTFLNDQVVTDFFHARSAVFYIPNIDLGGGKSEVLVGHATFTASASATGETFLNFVTRVEPSGAPSPEAATWREDGAPKNPTNGTYAAGAPVRVAVPEPGAVTLSALAGVALLARRGRRCSFKTASENEGR